MPHTHRTRAALTALALLLTACQTQAPIPTTSPPPTTTTVPTATVQPASPTPSRTSTPTPTATAERVGLTPIAPGEQLTVNLARADLAQRLQVAEDAITVLSIEAAELGQPNLGCPTTTDGPTIPGLVLGFIVHLEYQGQPYEYRASGRRLAYCGS